MTPLEKAAVALRVADGDDMSGDYAYDLARATILAYLDALIEENPERSWSDQDFADAIRALRDKVAS